MSIYEIGDVVWWFCMDGSNGNVYPEWLTICSGKVIWKSPDEEIMHVYCPGQTYVHILLDDNRFVFPSKKDALDAMKLRLTVITERNLIGF